jgi:hypothetical protein
MKKTPYQDADFSQFDLEDAAIAARRQLMYSEKALVTALPIDDLFVSHPEFAEALAGLDRIFQLATRVSMPHGMRLIGPSGAGKTSFLQYFQRSLPQSTLFSVGLGAIYVRVPERVTTAYLVGALMRQFGYVHKRVSHDMEDRSTILREAIRQKGTRLIMLDEAHNLIPKTYRGRPSRDGGTSPTDLLRQLMDQAKVGVVLAGTNELDAIGELDKSLGNRSVGRFTLSHFNYDTNWIRLLMGLIQQISEIDFSILLEPDVSKVLHKSTCGNLRSLKRMATEIGLVTVDAGAERVELIHIEKAHLMIYGAACQTGNPFAPADAK